MNCRKKALWDKSLLTLDDCSGHLNIFALAVPLFFQQVFTLLLGTVNTIALTRVSEDAVTAVNVANMLIDVPVMLANMIISGTVVILSLSLGAGKKNDVGRIYRTSLTSTMVLSGFLSVVLVVAAPRLLFAMHLDGNILACGVLYFRIRILFLFLTAATNCLTGVLRAHGYAKETMVSGILINTVNAVGSIFVVGKYYAGDKIVGVAVAAVLGQTAGMIYTFLALKRHTEIDRRGRFSVAFFKKIVSVGIPGGMSLFAFSVSTALSTSIIASLGQAAVNVKVYTANISHYTYLFGYALAQSCALMIGRHVGGKKYGEAKRLFRQTVRFVPLIDGLMAAAVWIFTQPLMRIFTNDAQLISAAHTIFLVDIAIEIARGNTHVGENALCSVADTVFTSIVSVVCCFCISALGSYIFCIKLHMGIFGFYAASILDEGIRGILYRIRWNRSQWMISVKRKV